MYEKNLSNIFQITTKSFWLQNGLRQKRISDCKLAMLANCFAMILEKNKKRDSKQKGKSLSTEMMMTNLDEQKKLSL